MLVRKVDSEEVEREGPEATLSGVDGILVPGGFGSRGTDGMLAAAEYARKTGTPYFGICYGFQWAVTEYARNVCGLGGANSTEVEPEAQHDAGRDRGAGEVAGARRAERQSEP